MQLLRYIFSAALAVCAATLASAQNAAVQAPNIQAPPRPGNGYGNRNANTNRDSVLLFVGTYSRDEGWVNGTGKGVHVFQFNTRSGALSPVGAKAFGFNPTFIAGTNDRTRRVIYAVNEVADDSQLKPGSKTGYVYAISVDAAGTMTELNRVESGGGGAAHVSVSPNEDYVTASNYGGGSVSIYPIAEDGSLQPASDFHQFVNGSMAKPDRQEAPHMHSMTWVGRGGSVFGADLGNDRIAQFKLDAETGKLVPDATNEFIKRPAGSGPRHMAIHPTRKYAYVVDELSNTIGVYALMSSGSLTATASQLISTLPAGYTKSSSSADIHTSECGRFLYSSNRGHNSIAIFRIGSRGQLTFVGHESTRGKIPRNFHIYKTFLLVANQETNNIEVFRINQATGKLTYANQSAECGTPVSLFIPRY